MIASWEEKTMPASDPGTLTRPQSLALVAYLLQAGKFPAGRDMLSDDAAQLPPKLEEYLLSVQPGYEDNPGYELIVHPPLAKQLMEVMGGSIGVESELGKGSSFSFVTTLPKASAEARQLAQAPLAPVQEAAVK